jgi:DUF438 domain-containing protein
LLHKIPHGEIVEVEQELINEGLPEEDIAQLCDVYALILDGNIDHSGSQKIPSGHLVSIFIRENQQLLEVIDNHGC